MITRHAMPSSAPQSGPDTGLMLKSPPQGVCARSLGRATPARACACVCGSWMIRFFKLYLSIGLAHRCRTGFRCGLDHWLLHNVTSSYHIAGTLRWAGLRSHASSTSGVTCMPSACGWRCFHHARCGARQYHVTTMMIAPSAVRFYQSGTIAQAQGRKICNTHRRMVSMGQPQWESCRRPGGASGIGEASSGFIAKGRRCLCRS